MRIKEFLISRYGPLSSSGTVALEDYNLLFGRNETGKSLTIDAMVRMLLGKGLRGFDKIDRVEESPEGYIVIEDSGGNEVKLPGSRGLREIAGLETDDCRNIFITRNSDLEVDQESGFYATVSNKLTGLKTEQIRGIITKLEEMGKLTPGGAFSNREQDGKLKSRLEKAGSLLGEIEKLRGKLTREGFDEVEAFAADLEAAIEEKKEYQAELENARMRDQYEKASAALEKYKKESDKLKFLEIYSEEKERIWAESEKRIEEKKKEEERHRQKLKQLEADKEEKSRELENSRADLKSMEKRKGQLDDWIKPDLAVCRNLMEELAGIDSRLGFWARLSWLSAALLGLSIIWIIADSAVVSGVVSAGLAVITALLWIMWYRPVRDKSSLNQKLEKLRMALSEIGINTKDFGDILQSISDFEDKYSVVKDRARNLEFQVENMTSVGESLRGEVIPEIRETINAAERKIDGIRAESGVESLADYRSKLAQLYESERVVSEQAMVLENLLEPGQEDEGVDAWERKVEKLERYSGESAHLSYSKTKAEQMASKIKDLEEELEGTRREMRSIGQELQEIGITANELLTPEEGEKLYCSTVQDLDEIKKQLCSFINENETRKKVVLQTIGIFKEIEREEREKVSELFGPEKPVSEHFSRITGGAYSVVNFDHLEEVIMVNDNRGNTLEAGGLSGGAYDQLYFSIRLALGEELLEGRRGFFILDDPFIKSDAERLQEQVKLLDGIVDDGWQIIFFSAKEEIREALQEQIESGKVNFIDMEEVYGSPGS